MTNPSAGYNLAEFAAANAEFARLDRQAAMFAREEERALEVVGLPTAGVLLDVGCGPGSVAQRLQKARPAMRVVGIDVEPQMVKLASQRGLPCATASALALPFADDVFDAIHTRFVLRHLSDAKAAVNALRRSLKPGGCLAVLDADDDTLIMHPAQDAFRRAYEARGAGARRRGADPNIGRKLGALLRTNGFSDVRIHPFYVHTGACSREDLAQLLSAWLQGIEPDVLAPDDVKRGAAELAAWTHDQDAFGMVGVVAASGRKTDA
ncbi:MAG: methyltransferase domain-containing protein [Sandaracinaceae bacterium]|nr:methyltransferase domain-containing protein [Sandaracinaceae bacterium]